MPTKTQKKATKPGAALIKVYPPIQKPEYEECPATTMWQVWYWDNNWQAACFGDKGKAEAEAESWADEGFPAALCRIDLPAVKMLRTDC